MQNMHANIFIAYADEPISMATGFSPSDLSRFHFLDVALYWCVTRYSTTFSNGVAKTVEISSRAQLTGDSLAKITNTVPPSPKQGGLDVMYNADFAKACYSPDPNGEACLGFGGEDVHLLAPSSSSSSSSSSSPPSGGGASLPNQSQSQTGSSGEEEKEKTHAVDLWTALTASYLTYFTLTGGLLQTWGLTMFAREGDVAFGLSAAIFGDRFGLEPYPPDQQLERMQRVVANMARGLSNGLRELAGGNPATAHIGEEAQFVRGKVFVQETVLSYDAKWLIGLAVQLGLVAGVLVWTVIKQGRVPLESRVPVMKDNALAVVYMVDMAGEFRRYENWEQDKLDKVAKETQVMMRLREDGRWVIDSGGPEVVEPAD